MSDTPTNNAKGYLRRLADHVSPDEYERIKRTALRILKGLPKDESLGTVTAALMLAAMFYAESAPTAATLIASDRRS